jgi:predicted aminopeptidase
MMLMLTETSAYGLRALPVVRSWSALALLTLLCLALGGCGTLYVAQAAGGELGVLRKREPIDKVLADPATPPELRAHLEQVRAARDFATTELGLPDNASYRSYADIKRRYVVWNVVAAPEFSVRPQHWCFPVAGCVSYRGYFHEARARAFADELAVQGYDVAVEGVPAYSTLGRFADPVLSSMLPYGDDELAATIFHELAHQLIYVRDDSSFNEAFATTVEDVGLERWLAHRGEGMRIAAYRADMTQQEELVQMFSRARARLSTLYAQHMPQDEMRARKAAIFHELGSQIQALERRYGARYTLYDEWIAAGLNNAHLASVATYYDCVPGFRRLLQQQDDDLTRFYAAVRALARQPRAARHAQLCSGATGPAGEESAED